MGKLKIYHVFESYPLFYQPYIPPTLEALTVDSNIDSKIIAFKGTSNTSQAEVLPTYRKRVIREFLHNKLHKSNSKLNYLEIQSLDNNVDVIHLQHSFLYQKILSLIELPLNKRPKVVITLRGGDTYVKPWVSKRWENFYHNYGNRIDAFVVMSEDQKKYLHRWRVPLERIHVIPISFGKPFEIEPRLPNQKILKIVSVFRLCWEKNIADNLRLIRQIKELGVNVAYDVYGDGRDMGQLYFLVDRYGLNDVVNIKGRQDNQVIKDNFYKYDFILQLSHSESFGMSIVEAQTHGVPAIVSNHGGLQEIVLDKITGIVTQDIDFKKISKNVVALWQDKAVYKDYSLSAIENSQKSFNTKSEVSKLSHLYTQLTSNS